MSYSHRDRRVHRFLWRVLAVTAAGSVLLGGLVFYGPTIALAVAGLVGLAALGAITISVGERGVAEYERDLRDVRGGDVASGLLRAEVRSDVGLERSVGLPSARSPHSRRGPPAGDGFVGRVSP
jgi:hypothetical protein